MKKELTIALLTLGLTVGMASMATAQQEQDTDVDVNVSEVTQLDVRPSALSYGSDNVSVEPGDNATVSDNGYEHIEIGNIGSEEIGEVYAQSTMPGSQPFGATGDQASTQFDTGNFVTLSTETANNGDYSQLEAGLYDEDTMHYLNRVEYSEETAPTYIDLEDGLANSEDDRHLGRIRAGGVEYFYVIYDETGDGLDDSGSNEFEIRIGNTPHTSTQLGTVDFSNEGSDYTVWDETNVSEAGNDYTRIEDQEFVTFNPSESNFNGESLISNGQADLSGLNEGDLASNQTRDYNLYAYADTTNGAHIARTKFNIDLASPTSAEDPGSTTSSRQFPIFSASGESSQLQPGDSFPVDIGIQIPQGVDEARINEGTVTVIASEEGSDTATQN